MNRKKNIDIVPNGLIFMCVATVLAYVGCNMQLKEKVFMGTAWPGVSTYEYNPVMYILGVVFYWGLLLLLYFVVFAKGMKRMTELTPVWRLAAYVLCLVQALIMFVVLDYVIYRSSDYLPVKNSLRLKLTVVGWPVMTAVFISIMFVCCICRRHDDDGHECHKAE